MQNKFTIANTMQEKTITMNRKSIAATEKMKAREKNEKYNKKSQIRNSNIDNKQLLST